MHGDSQNIGPKPQPKSAAIAQARRFYCHIIQLTVENITERSFQITAEQLASPTRGSPSVVFARHIAMYLAQVEGQLTLTETGALFGRDRRAVAYAIAQLECRREADPSFDRGLDGFGVQVRNAVDQIRTYQHLIGNTLQV
jgi:chromosomal replication initiation ATPase DnaA